MYRLTITTELNNTLSRTHHEKEYLIDCGDCHTSCQEYEIVDLDTGETVFHHCNLPPMLKVQAGGELG